MRKKFKSNIILGQYITWIDESAPKSFNIVTPKKICAIIRVGFIFLIMDNSALGNARISILGSYVLLASIDKIYEYIIVILGRFKEIYMCIYKFQFFGNGL